MIQIQLLNVVIINQGVLEVMIQVINLVRKGILGLCAKVVILKELFGVRDIQRVAYILVKVVKNSNTI